MDGQRNIQGSPRKCNPCHSCTCRRRCKFPQSWGSRSLWCLGRKCTWRCTCFRRCSWEGALVESLGGEVVVAVVVWGLLMTLTCSWSRSRRRWIPPWGHSRSQSSCWLVVGRLLGLVFGGCCWCWRWSIDCWIVLCDDERRWTKRRSYISTCATCACLLLRDRLRRGGKTANLCFSSPERPADPFTACPLRLLAFPLDRRQTALFVRRQSERMRDL